jgi:Zn-dependent peptidase ImmA (M78 family)
LISYIINDVSSLLKKAGSRNPIDLAHNLDILIREDRLGSLKGYIFFQSRIATVCINSELPEIYRSTVICHEIGHYRYHQKQARNLGFFEQNLFKQNCQNEHEANLFAAEFLLSDEIVLQTLNTMDIYAGAAALKVPAELLDYKLMLLQHKGYALRPCWLAASDFLKG